MQTSLGRSDEELVSELERVPATSVLPVHGTRREQGDIRVQRRGAARPTDRSARARVVHSVCFGGFVVVTIAANLDHSLAANVPITAQLVPTIPDGQLGIGGDRRILSHWREAATTPLAH
jgi:hypothetical protein